MRDVVLFDLDGTLVDSAHDIAAALNHLRTARHAPPIDVDIVRPLVALGAETLVETALGEVARDSAVDLVAFRNELRRAPASRCSIYPGVEAALASLLGAGCLMGIVTNKPEVLARNLIVQLGLDRYFRTIVGGDSVKRPKPHPDSIRLALDLLGVDKQRCLYVGDTMIDATAAGACSLPFILFDGGYGGSEFDQSTVQASFTSFEELPHMIRALP